MCGVIVYAGARRSSAQTAEVARRAFPQGKTPAYRTNTYISFQSVHVAICLYDCCMTADDPINISDARDQLASIIRRVRVEHEPVYLSRRGHRVAAVINADDLDRLMELAEDMADIRAAEEAREEMRQTRQEPIPWEEVKADLGLT